MAAKLAPSSEEAEEMVEAEAAEAADASDSGGLALAMPPPAENSVLYGHATAEKNLLDAMRRGQLHHGIWLCGKSGIGKASLAWRLARFVLAVQPGAPPPVASPPQSSLATPPQAAPSFGLGFDLPELPPPAAMAVPPKTPPPTENIPDLASAQNLAIPLDVPVMRQISARTHRDLFVIERGLGEAGGKAPPRQISVEQVRDLGGFMQLRPSQGIWRVVIIDAIDDFTPNAQNALLKLLEEPAAYCLILVVNHVAARMLPTLRSRCLKLALSPLSDAVMRQALTHYGLTDPAQLSLAVSLGEGSLGQAVVMLSGGVHEFYLQFLGLLARPDLASPAQTPACHQLAERLAASATARSRATKAATEPATDLFSHFCEVWPRFLTRVIAAAARAQSFPSQSSQSAPWSAAESEAARQLLRHLGLAGLVSLWEKSVVLLSDANRLTLDRKQIVLEILAAASVR
ncbi:MAG: hypothetical protein QM537_07280 [Candidatus Symbiobacter sp.]|nr:hypothetical protein [Candidatus Symbiobacter sp.]